MSDAVRDLATVGPDDIRVYSHPRSGTHVLMNALGLNLFPGRDDMASPPGQFGHWSNRAPLEPQPFGRLFGSHELYHADLPLPRFPLYVYRNGLAVAYSLWQSPQFNPKGLDVPFRRYLRRPIDWQGSVAFRAAPTESVLEHWARHIRGWVGGAAAYVVRFEELVEDYEATMRRLFDHLGVTVDRVVPLPGMVGIDPEGSADEFQGEVGVEDVELFEKVCALGLPGAR